MIDLKLLRSAPDQVRGALARRADPVVMELLGEIEVLDARRREVAGQLDGLKADRNVAARSDAKLVAQAGGLPAEVVEQRRRLGLDIDEREREVRDIESVLHAKAMLVPNLPWPDVPDGDVTRNEVVRTWGEPVPAGAPPHWEIAERHGLLDAARGAKISGSGFPLFVGAGARVVRGLINFMLDVHSREHGYVEVEPPIVVRRDAMIGTGQLPRFEADAYRTEPDDLFLVPTAEVPLTNMHSDEILDGARLPIAYTAHTPCFRREAGAAGRDTRGLLRVHQFDKIELVRFVRPDESPAELTRITAHAEEILRRLGLAYRVVALAAGDLGFASAKTFDLEVWAPGVGQWLEVSSASCCTDYQARRAGIRFRARPRDKPEFVHTLNASGVALPRTLAALLECGHQADGSVVLPPVLAPYVGRDRLTPAAPAATGAA